LAEAIITSIGSVRRDVQRTTAQPGLEPSMTTLARRELLLGMAASALAAPALAQSKEPILIGVTGPLTGQYAQYGAQWKRGFDVALDAINASGGINGRPLQHVFEDSKSDPRQSVTIARQYVADERILVQVGDSSSAA